MSKVKTINKIYENNPKIDYSRATNMIKYIDISMARKCLEFCFAKAVRTYLKYDIFNA